jgi:hypothetical protein
MQISFRAFWLPKSGNTEEEYEDAFWPAERISMRSPRFRLAVADGATETSFAGSWARLLSRAYCKDRLSETKIRDFLPRLQRQWQRSIGTKDKLPWYAQEKLLSGAYSTVLGLTLTEPQWEAMAIGDSCLFQIRNDEVVTSFPLASAGEFNNRPPLMSTNPENWDREVDRVSHIRGSWQPLDEFYLMTDAAACWFLGAMESGRRPSECLGFMAEDGASAFAQRIQSLRECGEMRNDDVTVLRVCPS